MKKIAVASLAAWILWLPISAPVCAQPSVVSKKIEAGGKSFQVNVVRAPLSLYRPKVLLAKGKVGATATLEEMAVGAGAAAAINGSFFDAYSKDEIKSPYHNLITGGAVAHIGDTGTTLGFAEDGGYLMERLKIRIKGGLDSNYGWPDDWYAFLLNHTAEQASVAAVYNSLWAGDSTPAKGTQIAVGSDYKVKESGAGPMLIPKGGFVIVFSGGEEYLAKKFLSGRIVNVRWTFADAGAPRGSEDHSAAFWSKCTEAVGCGPRLVAGGAVAYKPEAEGFMSPKILTNTGARSAVGVTAGGEILLVTCGSATVRQMADVMLALGAYDAINLDGGASSGLWADGKYATAPGRELSNALALVAR
ncbi:MAG: phosphodiester glycosidase family protein [bacterium]|jgi:hypothetical protein